MDRLKNSLFTCLMIIAVMLLAGCVQEPTAPAIPGPNETESPENEISELQSKIDSAYATYSALREIPSCHLYDNGTTIYSYCGDYASADSGGNFITVENDFILTSWGTYERPKVLISKPETLALVSADGPVYEFNECRTAITVGAGNEITTKPTIMPREQAWQGKDVDGNLYDEFFLKTTEKRCSKYITQAVKDKCLECLSQIK